MFRSCLPAQKTLTLTLSRGYTGEGTRRRPVAYCGVPMSDFPTPSHMTKPLATAALTFLLASVATAATYRPGQAVEAREGDDWSAATVQKQEGRKFQVKYGDGTEEWVTADRLRPAGGAAGDGAGATDAPASPSAASPARPAITTDGPFTAVPLSPPGRVGRRAAAGTPPVPPTTKPAAAFVDLTPAVDPALGGVERLIACADRPTAVVVVGRRDRDDTALLCLDTADPSKSESRVFSAHEQQVLGAADGGRWLLTKSTAFRGMSLHLWEFKADGYRLKANYTFTRGREQKTPGEAMLLGPTRLLVTEGFDTYLIDLPTRRQIAAVHGTGAKLHAGGRFLMMTEGREAVLLRTSDLAVVGTVPEADRFAVDPTGQYAAVAHGGGVDVIKLATKAKVGHVAGVAGRDLDLPNPDTLLVGGRTVYDVKTGVPVWQYGDDGGTRSAVLPGGQVLLVGPHDRETIAVAATLPDASAAAALKTAVAAPDAFVLRPGAKVAVKGDLSAFGDAAAARKKLDAALATAGHTADDAATDFVLNVASAAGPTGKFDTRPPGVIGPYYKEIDAPSTIVTVTLTHAGNTLWERKITFSADFIVTRKPGQSDEDAVAAAARPDADRLAGLDVPGYVIAGAAADKPATLGRSTLTRSGFVPVQK